jgi:hypothetical protein
VEDSSTVPVPVVVVGAFRGQAASRQAPAVLEATWGLAAVVVDQEAPPAELAVEHPVVVPREHLAGPTPEVAAVAAAMATQEAGALADPASQLSDFGAHSNGTFIIKM